MPTKKLPFAKSKMIFLHDLLIDNLKKKFKGVEMNINKQRNNFHADPQYKDYTGIRNDAKYSQWKKEVALKFDNICCVCLSQEKIVFHHLFSYKYYPDLRTETDNGVCLCEICHNNFNDLYSNASTLKQFIAFRNEYKGKPTKRLSFKQRFPATTISENEFKRRTTVKKTKHVPTAEEKAIIDGFENLKTTLINERTELQKQFGDANGVKINFRDKIITSKSAMSKLQYEIMRINTLIHCNKMRDKTIMAAEFHMAMEEFCKILQDPTQYLKFTDAQITHLNFILRKNYKKEIDQVYAQINADIQLKYKK